MMPYVRVYRNRRAGAVVLVFAAFVDILILTEALSGSQSAGLRTFGIIVALVIAVYAIRAASIEVRVGDDGIRVRNTLSTTHLRWSEISEVRVSPALSPRGSAPAYNVVFVRIDGSTVRAQALRKAQKNAASVASELAEIAKEHSAVFSAA